MAAAKSLKIFSETYHTEPKKEYNSYVLKFIKAASTDPNVAITRGYTLGLSAFSPILLTENVLLLIITKKGSLINITFKILFLLVFLNIKNNHKIKDNFELISPV